MQAQCSRLTCMKAIVVTSFTGPEGLQLQNVAEPVPEDKEVVVRIEAVGVNFADVRAAQGKYPGSPEPPFICGREFSGTVEPTGERVMGYTQHGACAERIAINRNFLFPAYPQWDAVLSAAFPVNFLTAWLAYWKAGLVHSSVANDPTPVAEKEKKRVLIHAVAGGVGTAAVQIGRMLGLEMFGTASSDEKLAKVRELGLTHGINYAREDYEQRVLELTKGEGVDAVFDSLGGEHTAKSLRVCRFLGRVIMFGNASGDRPKFDTLAMYNKASSAHGLWLSRLASNHALIQDALRQMQPWIAAGELKPVVGTVLPLEETADAHRLMLMRSNYGKIVLTVH